MPFKILRNDITKMNTDAIVNTASSEPFVGSGCDTAVYQAAGYDELFAYREEKIGSVPEGEVFITPGFNLPAKYIIHAVSPLYLDGDMGEEEKLRSCYRKSLQLACEKKFASIAFPLISTGSFGYPKEEGMRIALDEIQAFLGKSDESVDSTFGGENDELMVYLVVFDEKSTRIGTRLFPDLDVYIDRHYVEKKVEEEYPEDLWAPDVESNQRRENKSDKRSDTVSFFPQSSRLVGGIPAHNSACSVQMNVPSPRPESLKDAESPKDAESSKDSESSKDAESSKEKKPGHIFGSIFRRDTEERKEKPKEKPKENRGRKKEEKKPVAYESGIPDAVFGVRKDFADEEPAKESLAEESLEEAADVFFDFEEEHESKLEERMQHLADTFSEYLLYLIKEKQMENAEVYKRAIVDKKVFSKIKNNPAYHPQKLTALCLCVGAKLNMDETRDLLARAGYALSPCDKTDVIFSYFIENKIYDMIELDIQLEEHGLPCIIA